MNAKAINTLIASVILLCSSNSDTNADDCGLSKAFVHPTKHAGKRQVYADNKSLFFTAPMAVNTDGAPTSYHPDDPTGSDGLAINTICNGANAIMPNGSIIDYSKCASLIAAFKKAKSSGWADPSQPRMEFFGVAANKHVPCLIDKGTHAGYFVSTTSVLANDGKPTCDQERYLNSLEIPFAIYPNAKAFTARGVGKKDVVVYYNPKLEVIEFGIIGDRGPSWGLAEGSIAFAKTLNKRTDNPKSRKDTYKFGVDKIHALVLPNASLDSPYTADSIRERAKKEFESWGGKERFNACIHLFGE